MFKKTKEPKRQIVKIPCPNCGTMHDADLTKWEAYYLDGIPQGDIETLLNRYPICSKCGCIYKNDMTYWDGIPKVIQRPQYQQVLHSDIPLAEKKLQLMLHFPDIFIHAEGWIAHYCPPAQRTEALQAAIQAIEDEAAQTTQYIHYVPGCYVKQLCWSDPFVITPRICLIDLYRRAGMFEKALQQWQDESTEPYASTSKQMQQYLILQKQLIDEQNANDM